MSINVSDVTKTHHYSKWNKICQDKFYTTLFMNNLRKNRKSNFLKIFLYFWRGIVVYKKRRQAEKTWLKYDIINKKYEFSKICSIRQD